MLFLCYFDVCLANVAGESLCGLTLVLDIPRMSNINIQEGRKHISIQSSSFCLVDYNKEICRVFVSYLYKWHS